MVLRGLRTLRSVPQMPPISTGMTAEFLASGSPALRGCCMGTLTTPHHRHGRGFRAARHRFADALHKGSLLGAHEQRLPRACVDNRTNLGGVKK
jgi:hypothetical protein